MSRKQERIFNHFCEACEWEMQERGLTECPEHTCDENRPMTEGEAEIAKDLDDYFDKHMPKEKCHCEEIKEAIHDKRNMTKEDEQTIKDLAKIIHLYKYGSVFNGLDVEEILCATELLKIIKERK